MNRTKEALSKGLRPSLTRSRAFRAPLAAMAMALVAGCSDEVPTATGPGIIPLDAATFQVDLPFEGFASGLRIDGGYGVPESLIQAFLVRGMEEGEVAYPLARWTGFSPVVSVLVEGETTARSDTTWTVVGGEVLLRVDSVRVVGNAPFTITAHRILESYDPRSAGWLNAVDTLGAVVPWTSPGGGAVTPLGSAEWFPDLGDSIRIPLDSATAVALAASATGGVPSVRFSVQEQGAYLRAFQAEIALLVRPSLDPDSIYRLPAFGAGMTFIHSGTLDPSASSRLVAGGSPSFRSSFAFNLPESVQASGPICAPAQTCLVELTPDRILYAGLRLTPVASPSFLLTPADTVTLDLRPVLAPTLLPRAPLGISIQPQARRVPPSAFGPPGLSEVVELSVTRFVRDLLADRRSESPQGLTATVSLLTVSEPSGLGVATFAGPDTPQRPRLRLILTRSEGVSLR